MQHLCCTTCMYTFLALLSIAELVDEDLCAIAFLFLAMLYTLLLVSLSIL